MLLTILLVALGDPAASRPLTLTEALAGAPPARAPLQGVAYDRTPPAGWVSFGIQFTTSDQSLPVADSPDEDEPIGGDFGFYTWKNSEMGVGIEFGALYSEYEVDVSPFATDNVDVWRGTIGLRLVDAGISTLFAPFARAGVLWRSDRGSTIEDDGFGFYLGAGLDWYLAGGLALTPTLTYQDSNSFNTTEWLLGIALTLRY